MDENRLRHSLAVARKMIELNNIVSRREDIDTTDLNGDIVMMDLEKGKYFSLNSVGSRIWELMDKPVEIKEIIDSLLEEYDISRNECEENVLEFLGKLDEANIISVN